MTTQLTIFGTLDCTHIYPETPAAARDETLAALAERRAVLVARFTGAVLEDRPERVKAGGT